MTWGEIHHSPRLKKEGKATRPAMVCINYQSVSPLYHTNNIWIEATQHWWFQHKCFLAIQKTWSCAALVISMQEPMLNPKKLMRHWINGSRTIVTRTFVTRLCPRLDMSTIWWIPYLEPPPRMLLLPFKSSLASRGDTRGGAHYRVTRGLRRRRTTTACIIQQRGGAFQRGKWPNILEKGERERVLGRKVPRAAVTYVVIIGPTRRHKVKFVSRYHLILLSVI